MRLLHASALAFAGLALVAGALQLAAYFAGGSMRHVVLGGFACAVRCSVAAAAVGAILRSRR